MGRQQQTSSAGSGHSRSAPVHVHKGRINTKQKVKPAFAEDGPGGGVVFRLSQPRMLDARIRTLQFDLRSTNLCAEHGVRVVKWSDYSDRATGMIVRTLYCSREVRS
jgi:hypothetical protein